MGGWGKDEPFGGCCGLAKHSINKLCCHEIYKSAKGGKCRGCHKSQGSVEEQWVVGDAGGGSQGVVLLVWLVTRQLENKRPGQATTQEQRVASDPSGAQTDVALWLFVRLLPLLLPGLCRRRRQAPQLLLVIRGGSC